MSVDRLDSLLDRFSLSARLFFSGALCGITDFDEEEDIGYLHVIKRGPVKVRHSRTVKPGTLHIEQPSLLFYPRPLAHTFITDRHDGADMVCASVRYNMGQINPIATALPPIIAVPLSELPTLLPVIELMFAEAFTQQCGRQVVLNRLFEVLIVHLLRKAMNDKLLDTGLLAGLAHPQLAKSLVALHEAPARAWTLESLAECAGMSRSAFANTFRTTIGQTPGDYVTCWRLTLAQDLLQRGRSLKHIAAEVGYGSPVALARAFKARTGQTSRQWQAAGKQAVPAQ